MSESGVSLWGETARLPGDEPLGRDARADVCVVGAGIAGLTTAYQLTRAGRRVVVLDKGPTITPGETQFTTAHLSCVIDDRFQEVERVRGEDALRLAVASHKAAIHRIEAVASAEGIACDFRRVDGYLFLGPGDTMELLEKEADCARRIGLEHEWADRAPLPGFDTGRCVRFSNQGQFHPLKYLIGLHRAIVSLGGRVYTKSMVRGVEGGSPCKVHLRDGPTVTADAVVVATNTPINDIVSLHTKQAPYMTYALAAAVPAGSVPFGLYWDTLDPYHYIRLQPGERGQDLLIVGGEDHKTGQNADPAKCWEKLEQWARKRFPSAGKPRYRWSGQVMETLDGLAYIGRDPGGAKNVFIATGDSGMGMTHGTIAGLMLCDLVQGRENVWDGLYDPSRKPVKAAGEYLRENLNVAGQYADWITAGEVRGVETVPAGKGVVLRRGLKLLAAYREETGEVHECSAVCTHLGCVVHWNDAEKTWDCPCHGSRFSKEGHVLHGPATADLEPIAEASHAST
jgi:glycine/D-amino acid oxidase-like deaminating enzyme/nitrite reductase/ring-hydroxylating ferredoxin subunit